MMFGQQTSSGSPLAAVGARSRYVGDDNKEYTGTESLVVGVVPTGLFTTYVPSGQLNAMAKQAAYASAQDFARIHEGRIGNEGSGTEIYYTDDLYPPYYSKLKKTGSIRRKKPYCCQ